MPTANIAPLADRGVIRVAGADAVKLLDGLLTNSLSRLDATGAIHTGLLSPQGKILFDFFLVTAGKDLLIDVGRDMAADLIKRLSFYRLRADVTFTDMSDTLMVAALWPDGVTVPGGIISYPDPRNPDLGHRLVLPAGRLAEIPAETAPIEAYHAHRIALGVPEAGLDYPLSDTFPHEALYDQLASIDFKKGCFIGQEVVSRMQHRGTARKRAMRITSDEPLQPDTEITVGDATIGTIGSTAGTTAIAMLRLDRASEAAAKGTQLTAATARVTLAPPDWITFDIATGKPAGAAE